MRGLTAASTSLVLYSAIAVWFIALCLATGDTLQSLSS